MTNILLGVVIALFAARWALNWKATKIWDQRNSKVIEENNEAREYIKDMLKEIWEEVRTDKKGEE